MLTADSFLPGAQSVTIYPRHLAAAEHALYQRTLSAEKNVLKYFIEPGGRTISVGPPIIAEDDLLTLESKDWQQGAIQDIANTISSEINLRIERTFNEEEADFRILINPNRENDGFYSNSRYTVDFDEQRYLDANPDVAEAVNAGAFTSGFQHYVDMGKLEQRITGAGFDEIGYLNANPDVASAVNAGAFTSGFQHFVISGQAEGRTGAFLQRLADAEFTISIGEQTGLLVLNNGDEQEIIGPHTESTMVKWKQAFAEELGHVIGLEHPWDASDGDLGVSGPEITQTKSRMGQEALTTDADGFEKLDLYTLKLIWGGLGEVSPILNLQPLSGSIEFGDATVLAGNGIDFDNLVGGVGNDIFYQSEGNDFLNGGDGIDTVIFRGEKSMYALDRSSGQIDIFDQGDGQAFNLSRLTNIEVLQFSDGIGELSQLRELIVTQPDNGSDEFEFVPIPPSRSSGSVIIGTSADDIFDMSIVGTGNDIVDGGEGTDRIIYEGEKFQYTATPEFDTATPTYDAIITDFILGRGLDNEQAFAVDRFTSIELFQFSDGIVNLEQLLMNNAFTFSSFAQDGL